MNDCLICYETRSGLVSFECSHSMCSICLSKIQKQSCPFCRRKINVCESKKESHEPISTTQEFHYLEPFPELVRVRFRRRRGRTRTTTETIDIGNRTVMIESVHIRKRKKPKAGKNNFRKGRWASRVCPTNYR